MEDGSMLNLFKRLRERGNGRVSTVVCECRRCGMALGVEADRCPYCGPTNVVRYEF